MKDKVCITLSTYNNETIISKCLESCLEQDYPNLEVVVADDGSTDETLTILNQLALKYKNLYIISLPHQERGIARKEAITKAMEHKAAYLYFIDSDMILLEGLIYSCVQYLQEYPDVGGLVIPEIPRTEYTNFFSKVKVFERETVNFESEKVSANSIEAARFWRMEAYVTSEGLNEKQIAFEEIQPTIRYLEKGGTIRRAIFSGVYHDEGHVTLKNIISKKAYYFNQMPKTFQSEEQGFKKALTRWYFFRIGLYSIGNLKRYVKHPLLASGMFFMYIALTAVAIQSLLKSNRKPLKMEEETK
ncbi:MULTISPECIES: glycosyltransferase family 2 protein [Lysinibacillus]|uniref:Glycosyltransferase family 2 protein n=1 Tax=Lysinibacillus antri TaxID=2498145 RepID=A0A432LBK8_9BACI|nr:MULTISPECIES: glycosyltransferase family 2 protein [Lysinibacillus]RUL52005.1 glycosyltransferase family 2 protein [Lysinibacillus antri]TSI05938.1 glycosyltransferase family 2 protein [Lysinibacillus sp. BW-2-10]